MDKYKDLYLRKLTHDVIPFWEKNSIDEKYGGYFTCLNEDGSVYDTDKFVWLQARQVWTFAYLYNNLSSNPTWLEIAKQGAEFLIRFGRDNNHDWYFALDQKGQPLIAAYNIFSDCFACMAFAQLHKATNEEKYADIALETFRHIEQRSPNPKGFFEKRISSTRALDNIALPMIMSNLCLEMEHLLDSSRVDEILLETVHTIQTKFIDKQENILLENVLANGEMSDTMDGRLVNPGHAIETMWFMMDIAEKYEDEKLLHQSVKMLIRMIEYGWDQKYGGLFYFLDRLNKPMQQLEWDQKLWWPHLEALIGCSKAYALTGEAKPKEWFSKIHDYAWTHFDDEKNGEWYGYLHRDGTKLNSSKGGKWKGCFHLPRALFRVYTSISEHKSI